MKRAIYPGTFDPITHGHLDVLKRALSLFDVVEVVVAENSQKKTLLTAEERKAIICDSVGELKGVEVTIFNGGLVIDYARRTNACAMIRGLRQVADFEYEFQIALMNRHLAPDISTVFLMPDERYTYLTSSIIREVVRLGGDAGDFLPAPALSALQRAYRQGST